MTTQQRYAMPVDPAEWIIPSRFDSLMRWEYEDGRDSLLKLYEKGKDRQWNGNTRIDWSLDLDPENPQQLPDEQISIFGSDIWNKLTPAERANLRRHLQAQQLSQFMHGEQGALLCAAKIVQQVPSVDAKFYAATQVVDEARHVEVYARLLHEKFELAYPITPTLKSLLDQVLTDARWDMTYLGMQVLIEGLALAAFASIRDHAKNPLASERMKQFRTRLFTRIVPTIKDIGLWGPRIRKAYADMGVMSYAEVDAEGLLAKDEQVAAEFDARRTASA